MIVIRNLIDDMDDLDGHDMATEAAPPCHLNDDISEAYDRSPLMDHDRSPLMCRDRSPLMCNSRYGCVPDLILSDSEESSFASCGTEEFFDLEEISSTLNLIENWQKLHRRVKFGSARVQQYAITVGDHPICKDGLALSLDWAHAKEEVYDIDDYESRRQNRNQRRGMKRRRRVSKLDYWQRRETLTRIGSFSNADLSRIECKRNRDAVSEFLQDLGADDYGPSLVEEEEQGIELEQVYGEQGIELEERNDTNDDPSSFLTEDGFGWQMNVQILEG